MHLFIRVYFNFFLYLFSNFLVIVVVVVVVVVVVFIVIIHRHVDLGFFPLEQKKKSKSINLKPI